MIDTEAIVQVESVEDVQDAVRSGGPMLPRGGGTKPALSAPHNGCTVLDLSALSGILEYDPGEYTFTARAGTPLQTVAAALAEHGQYMPFDPPFVERGATLGGTVAAGLSGSGRYRYGGVRDFLIGVRFVDGRGEVVRGGGKVVKNAAGFDLPKLLTGSLGRLGVLTEVSFKVFPQPRGYITVQREYATLAAAIEMLHKLSSAPFDIEALDLLPHAGASEPAASLWVRLGGLETVLPDRAEIMQQYLGDGTVLSGEEESRHWRGSTEFGWLPADAALIKVPTTPNKLAGLDARLAAAGASRRYAVAGNLAWIGWPGPVDDLHALLSELGLSGLALTGPSQRPYLGVQRGQAFVRRIKQALDPDGIFLPA